MDHTFGAGPLPNCWGSRLSAFSIPPLVKNTLDVIYLLIIMYKTFNPASKQMLSQGKLLPSLPQVPKFRELLLLGHS